MAPTSSGSTMMRLVRLNPVRTRRLAAVPMADDTSASIIQLHQPKPKTAAERGRAFRERQRNKSAVRSAKAAPSPAEPVEKSRTFANGAPKFAELEKSTAELVAACQRGIEAARLMVGRSK
jgi:hypothetical protein